MEIIKKVAEREGFSDKVSIINKDEGLPSGTNYHGVIKYVRLEEADRNLSLFIKTPCKDEVGRKLLKMDIKYINEVNFYTKVYPKLQEFGTLPRIPKCYFSSLKNGEEVLVLEDLCSEGFRLRDIQDGFNDYEVEIALKALQQLHMTSRNFRQTDPTLFKKYSHYIQETFFHGDMIMPLVTLCKRNAVLSAKIYLDESYVMKVEEFDIVKDLTEMTLNNQCDTREYDLVFTHGDAWANNFMFKYNDAGIPVEVALVDWQMCRMGTPILDISYLIFSSAHWKASKSLLPNTMAKFGLGMTIFLLPFALHQLEAIDLDKADKLYVKPLPLAFKRIAAAIKAAVDNDIL